MKVWVTTTTTATTTAAAPSSKKNGETDKERIAKPSQLVKRENNDKRGTATGTVHRAVYLCFVSVSSVHVYHISNGNSG